MMKIVRFFGKLLGAVLVLVFIVSMFSSIFLLAITTQLFDPDFFIEAFEEQEFFDQLPKIAATQIRYSMTFNPCLEDPAMCENEGPPEEDEGGGGGPPSYFQALSEDDWSTLLEELLPEDWLETQIHDLLHNLVESIKTGSENIPVGISLTELKDNLTGESGVDAITGIMKAQPECSEDDLLEITRILDGSDESGKDFLSCSPGDEFLDNYAPQIEALLSRSLKDIPDEIDIAKGLGEKPIEIESLEIEVPITALINFGRWLILVSPLFNFLLLLVIAILAVHSFKGLSGWWGYPVAIAGLLAAGVASLVSPAAKLLSSNFLQDPPMAGLHEDLVDLASGVALEILRLIFNQARNYALIVTGIGLAIIIIASVLKKPRPKPETTEQDPDGEESIPGDGVGEDEKDSSTPEEEKADSADEESPPDEEQEKASSQDDEEEDLIPPDDEEQDTKEETPVDDDPGEETSQVDDEESAPSSDETESED